MRKIFVMLVFCGMASLASAAVDVYITDAQGSSEIYLTPSQNVNLYLWYTGDDIIFFDATVTCTGPGTISATLGTYEDLGGNPNPNITAFNRNPQYDAVINVYEEDGETIIPNAYEMVGSSDAAALGKGMDPALAWISFHCESPGDVTIALGYKWFMDANWDEIVPTMHGMTIHQIPEPATIALLCLGGLFLKRKK